MNGRQRKRDGEGRGGHRRTVCQHNPLTAKFCGCVHEEEDLDLGNVCLGERGLRLCACATDYLLAENKFKVLIRSVI